MILQKDSPAPEFNLYSTPDQRLKLGDFKGQRVILAFYPADWSPICSDELNLFNETLKLFTAKNAVLLGISVDSKWSHLAFAQSRKFHFPLLSDFEPKGEVSRQYGVYNDVDGESKRAIFLIDEHGIIQWSYLSPDGINPGAEGILAALDDMDKAKK
ncbi:redoxin domain-containing protein [Chitinophaga silvatica]|uniref:redoxin domain-containing protein n=1 Tax=Chitinophaga silvatica TaxID=2282649 RepID=UPI001F2F6E06|nr:redoxin domain-containing protein [Chitinophaga silvatica]